MTRYVRALFTSVSLLAAATLLGACASGPPKPDVDFKPDYNFSAVKTVGFYRDSGEVVGDNPLQLSDIQRGRIDEALVFAMKNKGFEIVQDPAAADLLISWHLVTQHKTDVQTWNTPAYGYYGPYNRYSRYNCWSCMPMQTDVTVRNYTEGTFIVDLIDPEMGKSVWRGTTQSRLKKDPSTDQNDYNEAATVIFASFPPGAS